jgi:ABC-type Fe3+-hydroxamate transport system substrate-binding protein
MASNVQQSLAGVIDAMQRLNQQFEDKIEELRQKGKDEVELQILVKGAMAMKDASGIYLSWANHYIARLQQTEGMEPDDEESIIVEE